jgi:hypothetical protein
MDTLAPSLMAQNSNLKPPKRRAMPTTIDEATGLPVAVPSPRQRTPLKRLEDVKRELGRVYRAMKSGQIPHEDGTKRAYVLDQLGKVIQMADLERRLDVLERQQAKLLPNELRQQAGGE